jgi:hypothetical protein
MYKKNSKNQSNSLVLFFVYILLLYVIIASMPMRNRDSTDVNSIKDIQKSCMMGNCYTSIKLQDRGTSPHENRHYILVCLFWTIYNG